MQRSESRMLTTHTGRLPNPPNMRELLAARANDPAKFDALVQGGGADRVRKQMALKNDLHCDGEFWKARDQMAYDSRAPGIAMQPGTADKPAWRLALQLERQLPAFRAFYAIYDAVGHTPMPGVTLQPATHRAVMTGPLAYRGQGAIQHDIAVVKAGIAAAGANVEDFFFPLLSPGWVAHVLGNEYDQPEEAYCYALADCCQGDYEAVVAAGFVLQSDAPALGTRCGMANPPLSIAAYRKHVEMRIAATNYALRHIPEDRIRSHTCWGSWHTPHTPDLPFRHVIDRMRTVKAQAYAVEAADVRHQLDWQLWEEGKLPEGKSYIPGGVAHKPTTVESPELVAERLVTYARIMGREHVIAGTDCGYGNRVYPDIGWAKMRAVAEGAALASQQLWPRGS